MFKDREEAVKRIAELSKEVWKKIYTEVPSDDLYSGAYDPDTPYAEAIVDLLTQEGIKLY